MHSQSTPQEDWRTRGESAVGRETLRDADHLHALYQQTNKEFFGGQLHDVEENRVTYQMKMRQGSRMKR